jgi:hypothetical protein
MSNHTTITSSDIVPVLERSAKAGNRKPPLFLGWYGLAKSMMVKKFADDNGYHFIDFRVAYKTFNDVRGFPMPNRETGIMEWFPDEDWDFHPTKRNVICFDEIGQGQVSTFKATMQAILDRRVGKMEFPEGTIICAASNKLDQKTGCQRMLAALVDRFAIYEVRPDIMSFQSHLEQEGKSPEVLAFINANSDAPYNFKIEDWSGEENLPTFRSFSRLDELVASYDSAVEAASDPLFLQHAQSCVGPKYGSMFAEFIKLASKVGDVGRMVDECRTCDIPKEPNLQWLVACRLITLASKENLKNILTLAQRLSTPNDPDWKSRKEPSMMQMFVGNGLRRRRSDLHRTETMLSWLAHYGEFIVD